MNNMVNYLLMLCIGVNVMSLNYFIGTILHVSGQQVSAIVNIFGFVIMALHFNTILKTPLIGLTILVIFVVPLIGYVANYQGQDFTGLLFWVKRVGINVITLGVSAVLVDRLSNRSLVYLSEVFFIGTCASVLYSYFYPEEALTLFTSGDEERWGDLSQISTSRASGMFINPNSAGIAMVICYLVYHIFLVTSSIRPSLMYASILDVLLILCILLTGARSTLPIGVLCVIVLNFFQSNYSVTLKSVQPNNLYKNKIRRLFYLSGFLLFGSIIFSEIFSSIAVERIVSSFTGKSDDEALDSTELRMVAIKYGLRLIFENPIFGVGFEGREIQNVILPHNMFVYYAEINGIFLGSIYIYFIYVILKKIRTTNFIWLKMCIVILIIGFSFFSHTIIFDKPFPWLIVAAVHLIREQRRLSLKTIKNNEYFKIN